MTELHKLVTADAVKAALRSEEVRGKMKETIRKTFEAQIDADVEGILDELIGPPEAPSGAQANDASAENGDVQPEPPSENETQLGDVLQSEPATIL